MKQANLVAILLLVIGIAFGQSNNKEVLGDWEGQSLCTIKDSPCHDEHVVYHIKPDEKASGKLEISANKIVNGEELYMGSLTCTFEPAKHQLHCQYKPTDHWEFTIVGDKMTGTLVIEDNKLYRRISVTRVKPK